MPTIVPQQRTLSEPASPLHHDGYDLLDVLLMLARNKNTLILWTLAFLIFGACIALLRRPVFTATAVIMPPREEQSATRSLIGEIGSLSSLGANAGLGVKDPADMYVGMLQSRVVADKILTRFSLQGIYGQRLRTGARSILRKNTNIEAAKDGLIYIKVKGGDPNLVAAIANGYVDALHLLSANLAIEEAAQRRQFFERRSLDEKQTLAIAENDLKEAEQKTGIIQLTGQEAATIQNISALRAEITSAEAELSVMHTFSTQQNPSTLRLKEEIEARKKALHAFQTSEATVTPGNLSLGSGSIPSSGMEYLRKLREVRYHESLSEMLSKQLAAASLDEAKATPLIQVIDPAEAPEERSGPSRPLITLSAAIVGLLLGSAYTVVRGIAKQLQSFSNVSERLAELRDALSRTSAGTN